MNGFVPTPKMATSGIAGAVSIIIIWILDQFGVKTSAEVASAFTVIVSFIAGYFAPHSEPTPEQIQQIKNQT